MKKTKKILIISIIAILIITLNVNITNAFSITDLTGNITVDQYGNPVDTNELETKGNQVLTIVSTVGSIMSVIMLLILGIKYMAGSVEEKAQYKSSLLPYFIGACLVFGATTIYLILYNLKIF